MWYIYKHTNTINGRCYIGQSMRYSPEVRWRDGEGYKTQSKFYRAVVKYGWENFSHEIIEKDIPSKKIANEREKFWIKFFRANTKGYNSTKGGEGMNFRNSKKIIKIHPYSLKPVKEFNTIDEAIVDTGYKNMREWIGKGCEGKVNGFFWCLKKDYKHFSNPCNCIYKIDYKWYGLKQFLEMNEYLIMEDTIKQLLKDDFENYGWGSQIIKINAIPKLKNLYLLRKGPITFGYQYEALVDLDNHTYQYIDYHLAVGYDPKIILLHGREHSVIEGNWRENVRQDSEKFYQNYFSPENQKKIVRFNLDRLNHFHKYRLMYKRVYGGYTKK